MRTVNDTHTTAQRASILARRLTLALMGVVLGVGIVFVMFEYLRGRRELLREAQNQLATRVQLIAERADAALRERQRVVDLWPQLDAAQDLAVDDVDQRLTASLVQLGQSLGAGTTAFATDTTGRVIAASKQQLIGRHAPPPRGDVLFTSADVFSRTDQRRLGRIVIATPWRPLLESAAGPFAGSMTVARDTQLIYGVRAGASALTAARTIQPIANLRLTFVSAQSRALVLAPLRRTQRQLLLFVALLLLIAGPLMLALARANAVVLAQQERLAAVGVMAASLAHEIRTPLAVLRASADVLARPHDGSTRQSEVVSFIVEETQRLEQLVNDLLTFARPRAPSLQPTDLAEIAQRAAYSLESYARERAVLIRTQLSGAPLSADPDQLYQVVLNLATNALHASEPGTEINISTGIDTTHAVLRVDDHGSGMDAATVDKMWQPFFSQRAGGTGLGLAIVKRIVDDHRGRVLVSSSVGAGTRITVELPTSGVST